MIKLDFGVIQIIYDVEEDKFYIQKDYGLFFEVDRERFDSHLEQYFEDNTEFKL